MRSGDPVGGDVLDAVAALVAERNRIDARLARSVRAAELSQAPERDGQRSMAAWLRGHCRLSPAEASRLVGNGRAPEHLPALGDAHDAGLVSAEQVAVEQPHGDLVQVVQRHLDDLDPDGPEPDPTEGRSLTLARHTDGSLSIRGELDTVGGETFAVALESLTQADRPAGDERSRAQRLGDALVQSCDDALAAGGLPTLRTVEPHVGPHRPRRPRRPHRPRGRQERRDPRLRRGPLRRPRPLAGLRRHRLPRRGRPRRRAAGPRPRTPPRRPPPAPRGRTARRRLRVHRLRRPDLVGRRPPPRAPDRRRRDQPRELSVALRTPPHPGPPRLPRRTTTRRSMAHLATRRVTDHHSRGTVARRLTAPCGADIRARQRPPPPGPGCCGGWRGRSRRAPAAGRRRGRG